ncbi:MAG: 3-phosphoshikimate 1-carboxyvinyltransferase [Candidatus Margulisiibacteriota bacterium]
MKKLIVHPVEKIKAEITVPGDKSISHRAIMLGAIAKGETVVSNFLLSADCLATIDCFRKMGVEIEIPDPGSMIPARKVVIKGKGLHGLKQPHSTLYVGNSGTTIRLMTGILAGQSFDSVITGDESICHRPMLRILSPLRGMGASIEGENENKEIKIDEHTSVKGPFAPLRIAGTELKANNTPIGLKVASAQVKSAILLAGLYAKGMTSVAEHFQSRDHTERMLQEFGIKVIVKDIKNVVEEKEFLIKEIWIEGLHELAGTEIDVPGDISSAAFFMVAGAIVPNSEILIKNVGINPTRDGIIDILHRMGAGIEVVNERILSNEPRADIRCKGSKGQRAIGIKIDGEIIPKIIDEIPIIAVLATQAEGITEIRGARELRVKESDRIKTVATELRKFGANIEELDDGLRITGPTKLKGAKIESYGDHRIAMAMAIAGLIAEGETEINNTECIETSFPGFAGILSKLR